jgi:parvulin-like peptidyl-prolyl isomerase
LAAEVNGEPITLASFEEALARQQQGQSTILEDEGGTPVNQETQVLDMLIERALIEQAAAANGITVTQEMVDQQLNELRQVAQETGGEGSFEAWLQANQWTEESFREALAYEMLTERVSTFVTADVPDVVPQVRARYIQVDDQALAQTLLDQVNNGGDFAALAQEHSLDRATAQDGGDLGYFAEGTLLVPELEQAAFSLQPGEVSDVITATTPDGGQTVYYLVQVVDVDMERPLGPDQRAALLQERFEAWLAEQWSQAEIVRHIDTGA